MALVATAGRPACLAQRPPWRGRRERL